MPCTTAPLPATAGIDLSVLGPQNPASTRRRSATVLSIQQPRPPSWARARGRNPQIRSWWVTSCTPTRTPEAVRELWIGWRKWPACQRAVPPELSRTRPAACGRKQNPLPRRGRSARLRSTWRRNPRLDRRAWVPDCRRVFVHTDSCCPLASGKFLLVPLPPLAPPQPLQAPPALAHPASPDRKSVV